MSNIRKIHNFSDIALDRQVVEIVNGTNGHISELADDASGDTTGGKHVSDAQVKKYEDHRLIVNANPHGTDHSQLDGIEGTGTHHITAGENAEITAIDGIAAGLIAKTADATYAGRTITGTVTEITVTDGDGVSGNPTVSLPDMISTPRQFGASADYTEFEAGGTMVFKGAATVWNDINISVSSLAPGATAPGDFTIPGTSLKIKAFTGTAATQSAHGSLEILHDYQEGTDIVPHLHWCPTTTGVGNVKWQLEYSWMNGGGVITSSTTISITAAASGTVAHEQRTNFPAISGAGKTIGSRFVFRLFRDPSDVADTYGADAGAFDFGLHYSIDTLGSRQITTK